MVAAAAVSISASPPAGADELSGAAAIADAVLWGREMTAAALAPDLPRNVQADVAGYRERERAFRSALTPPPGATPGERETYDRRVGIERVVFCLFPRGDSAKVAPQYALDADIEPDWQGMPEMPRREVHRSAAGRSPQAVAGAVPESGGGAPEAVRERNGWRRGRCAERGDGRGRPPSADPRPRRRQPLPPYNCSTV
jgi:hypothetical protein